MSKVELHLGDCLELIKEIQGETIDLVFADPPFNVGKNYGNGHDDKRDGYYEWCDQWIGECFRVLKNTGSMYLMTIPRHLEKMYPMMGHRGVFINQVNWRNVSANHSKRGFWSSTQPILVYGKTKEYIFNIYAQVRDINKLQRRWGGYSTEPKGTYLDYWDDIPFVYAGSISHPEAVMKKGTNQKIHPAQMPIELIKRAILFSTNEGDTVLEPFSGLAAGAVACIETKRNYIGMEQNQEFIDVARNRITNARATLGEVARPLPHNLTQANAF